MADRPTTTPLFGVPGIKIAGADRYHIHRTHLPLLSDDPRAVAELFSTFKSDWAARDRATAERGFKCRNAQHQGIDFITQRPRVLLGDDMRVGKGQPHGTKVLGPSGWCNIEHVKVGDEVFGADGAAVKITGVFPRGVLPVFRVTFSDGSSVRVDGDHLWATWDHNDWHRGKPPRTLSTAVLAPQLRDANNLRWRIPLVRPLLFPKRTLPIDPYLLGVLLGDGALSQGSVQFCCGDEEVPREVARVLPDDVKLVCTRTKNKAPSWSISSKQPRKNSVLAAIRALGLYGTCSNTKFVPLDFLHSAPEQRLALLQGLLDTDGEWGQGHLAFSSASENLRDAVRFLVESLGGVARASLRAEPHYTYKGERRTGRPSYRLTLALPAGIEPFRARVGYSPRAKFQPTRHIKSIEPDGVEEVVCIAVDAPDQLYVTEHCIVTHNTLTSLMTHDPASGKLVVICPSMVRPVWIGWIRRVFPDVPIGVMRGRKFDPKIYQHAIVVGHYDILPSWQSGAPIGTLIFDEAHFLTNRASARSKAAVLLASRTERLICATGTPIWNMPPDLWNIIGMLAPGAFDDYHTFSNRYGLPESTAYGMKYTGISNEDELKARLSEIMIRRRWIDVVEDIPPITRNVVMVEIDQRTRNKLDIMVGALGDQATKHTTVGLLSRYREASAKLKLATAVKEIANALERGEPIVVWTWHVELAQQIGQALGPDGFVLTGETNNTTRKDGTNDRDAIIAAWKAHPTGGALICTMSVAQVGLDFSHARLGLFVEIDWTPAVIAQAEMRTFDLLRGMNITYVVVDHMIDQRIVMGLMRKLGAANPLGVGAANDAISTLHAALAGPIEQPDLARLLEDLLAA